MYCTNAVKSTLYFATCYTLYSTILCRQILARILAIQPYAVVMQYSLSNLPSLFSDICMYAHLFFSSYVSCIHNRTFLLRTTTLLVILYAHTMHIFIDKCLEEQEILTYIIILYVESSHHIVDLFNSQFMQYKIGLYLSTRNFSIVILEG